MIEMIPREYWRQLHKELSAMPWDEWEAEENAKIQAERRMRDLEFAEAIRRKKRQQCHQRRQRKPLTPEQKERRRQYLKEYWRKKHP